MNHLELRAFYRAEIRRLEDSDELDKPHNGLRHATPNPTFLQKECPHCYTINLRRDQLKLDEAWDDTKPPPKGSTDAGTGKARTKSTRDEAVERLIERLQLEESP